MTDSATALVTQDDDSPVPRSTVVRRRGQLLAGYRAAGLATSLGVLLYMMWPNFHSDFAVIDDHTDIDMIGRHPRLPISQIPHWILTKTAEPSGRFRPLYWVGQVLESAVAGHHPGLWYFDRYLFAAVTATAIYLTALRFTGAFGAAVLSVLPFSGFQFETWVRLGPNEAYAMPLATVGIALLVRAAAAGQPPRRQRWAYALLLCSAYTKENFLLFAALGVAVSVLVHGWRRLQRADLVVLGVVAGLGLLDAVAILVKTEIHGAVYPQSRTLSTVKAWANYARASGNPNQGFTVGAVVALVLLGIYATTRQRAAIALALAGTVALLIATQIGFYAGNPAVGRYLYPLAIVPSIVWGVCLWRVRGIGWWPARLATSGVLLLAMLVPLHTGIGPSRQYAVVAAQDNRAFAQSLRTMERTIRADGARLVVLQPYDALVDLERTVSLARYLADAGGFDVMIARPAIRKPGFDTLLAEQIDHLATYGEHNILPFAPKGKCFSVLYGPTPPICGASTPSL